MATQYSLNVNSLFLPNLLPKPNSQTSTNPYNLSFSGGHLDAYSLMTDRLKNLFNDRFKSLYKFLDNTESLNPSKGFTSLTKLTKTPQKKSSFKDLLLKGVNFIKNNAGKGAKGLGIGLSVASQFLGDDEEIKNKNEAVSRELGSTVANAAPTLGPYGWLYKGLYDISSKTGGLLSGSNTKEFLDNGSFLADAGNTVLGAIPGLGWAFSKSPEYLDNPLVRSSMYYSNVGQFGLLHGGKKFAFNRGEINEQLKKDNLNTEVTAEHIIKPGKLAYMFDPDSVALGIKTDLEGGPTFELRGKHGMVLLFTKRTLSKSKISKYLNGKSIVRQTSDGNFEIELERTPSYEEWVKNVPEEYNNKNYDLELLYNRATLEKELGNPKLWNQLLGWLWAITRPTSEERDFYGKMQIPDEHGLLYNPYHLGSVLEEWNENNEPTGNYIFLKLGTEEDNPEVHWETDLYRSGQSEISKTHNLEFKNGRYYYIAKNPEKFKEGGKVNVIPSGALHAHKNNLTEKAEDGEKFEDVTTKGIPVVVEDEKGNLIQQAEVEREEIIFRLEVTKKLEELSKKQTDEAAIEAGKLLVKEILYNTKDNTGKMI